MDENASAARKRAEQQFAQISDPVPAREKEKSSGTQTRMDAVEDRNKRLKEMRLARDAAAGPLAGKTRTD